MRYAGRLIVAVLAMAVAWSVLSVTVLAQDAPPEERPAAADVDRSSPEATVFGFIGAYLDATRRERPERMADAVAYLDLSGVAEAERDAEGRRLAGLLKDVLDFHGRLERSQVPGAVEIGSVETWRLRTAQGPVVLMKSGDGWRFSAGTLEQVEEMRARFAGSGADLYRPFTLRDHLGGVWKVEVIFLRLWQWVGLFLLPVLGWLAARIVMWLTGTVLAALFRKRSYLERVAAAAVTASRPVGLLAVAAVIAVATPFLEFPSHPIHLERWLLLLGKLFACAGVVLLCYRCADVVSARLQAAAEKTESRLDDQLVPLVRRSIKLVVTVGGLLFILDNLDVDITSLLAGVGVLSLGLALAAKDTLANFFGSVTVFVDRPFQVGDWVVIGGVEGTVEEVGFRSTRVRTFYNSLVTVPNSKLVDTAMDNMGLRRWRRFRTTVGVQYDTPPERIEAFTAGMREIVYANPSMRHDYFEIYLNDFGPSSLDILVYVFFDVPDWDAELRERQNFMVEVIRLAKAIDVEFAFPTQTLHLASTPERPLPDPGEQVIDELDAVLRRFRKGGDLSRPGGTVRFSTASDTESETRGSADDEG